MNQTDLFPVRITKAHLDSVAEIERLCFSEPWSARALELLLDETQAVGFVCERDGTVQAYGGMLITPFDGQITNIAVHPNARRQGLGGAILLSLLEEAARRALESVSLEVRISNTAAIALYERYGFTAVGRRKNFYRAPTEDALVMLKMLD